MTNEQHYDHVVELVKNATPVDKVADSAFVDAVFDYCFSNLPLPDKANHEKDVAELAPILESQTTIAWFLENYKTMSPPIFVIAAAQVLLRLKSFDIDPLRIKNFDTFGRNHGRIIVYSIKPFARK